VSLKLQSLGIGIVSLIAALLLCWSGAAFGLREPPSAIKAILGSLFVSGGIALAIGIAVLVVGMPFLPRLSLKIGFGYLVGSAAAIITVLYTPLLMFKTPDDVHLLVLLQLCFLVVMLGLAAIVALTVTHPLHSLQQAARRVGAGHYETQVEVWIRLSPPCGSWSRQSGMALSTIPRRSATTTTGFTAKFPISSF